MGKSVRAFIALELPAAITGLAADLQNRIQQHGLRLKWVRPGNMHLTLKFLGDVDADRIEAIAAAMREAARQIPPMDLTIQGMGVFPGIRKPRVLWIGVGGATDTLQRCHLSLEERLTALGFQGDGRSFKAHLTLARINPPVDTQRLSDIIRMEGGYTANPFQVGEMVLFQSTLRPQGPIYTSLARAPLGVSG